MAKSVQMARSAYRVRGRKWVPDQVFTSAGVMFVSTDGLRAVKAAAAANAPVFGATPEPAGTLFGLRVFVNDAMCAAHWEFTGYPLRSWAQRYLRRFA